MDIIEIIVFNAFRKRMYSVSGCYYDGIGPHVHKETENEEQDQLINTVALT